MLIDPTLTETIFAPARNKTSVDGAEVLAHLAKIKAAVANGNIQYENLQEHAKSLADQNASLSKRVQELESRPTPTEQQIKTIKLAEALHERIVEVAKKTALELTHHAEKEAQRIILEAKAEGERRIDEFSDQANMLNRRIDKLSQFEREHYTRLQAFLAGQVQSLGAREPEKLVAPKE